MGQIPVSTGVRSARVTCRSRYHVHVEIERNPIRTGVYLLHTGKMSRDNADHEAGRLTHDYAKFIQAEGAMRHTGSKCGPRRWRR